MATNDSPSEFEERPQSRREWSGWLRSLVLPLGIVVAIVGALLYIQSGSGDDADDGYGTVALPADKNSSGREPAAETGRVAPDFLLKALDGDDVRFSDLRGRPVLVNFWSTWCTTCRAEMPDLVAAYETHAEDGLVLLGINLREADSRVQPFVDDFGMTFPVLLDRQGEVARTWRIGGPSEGLPSSYFIDRDGVVVRVVYGFLSARALDEGLALILKAND
jgi:peroxiredoxin